MTRKKLLILAAVVVGLVLLVTINERLDQGTTSSAGGLLFDDFAAHANDVQEIHMLFPGGKPAFSVRRDDGKWLVDARDDYPADVGKLGQLVAALAKAEIVEQATSNPERYSAINVDDPEQGGSGSKLVITGDGFSYELIVGKTAQRDFSYVRIAGDPASYLVNQKITVADDPSSWLLASIVDIPAERVRRVSIRHADGETLVIEKSAREDSNFTVADIPAGRKLSYASVANGIGGALSALTLTNVRRSAAGDTDVTTVVETWNGLRVTVETTTADDMTWLAFAADTLPVDTAMDAAAADAAPADSGAEADEAPAAEADDKAKGPDAAEEAATINARLAGWQYGIADYKKNLFTRRWDDILAKE